MDWLIFTEEKKKTFLCILYLQLQLVIFLGGSLTDLSMEVVRSPYQETLKEMIFCLLDVSVEFLPEECVVLSFVIDLSRKLNINCSSSEQFSE